MRCWPQRATRGRSEHAPPHSLTPARTTNARVASGPGAVLAADQFYVDAREARTTGGRRTEEKIMNEFIALETGEYRL